MEGSSEKAFKDKFKKCKKKITMTEWEIPPGGGWCNPKAVCFDSMPQQGWFKKNRFDWNEIDMTGEGNMRLC